MGAFKYIQEHAWIVQRLWGLVKQSRTIRLHGVIRAKIEDKKKNNNVNMHVLSTKSRGDLLYYNFIPVIVLSRGLGLDLYITNNIGLHFPHSS